MTESALIALIEAGDSLGLWQLAEMAGIEDDSRPRDAVATDIIGTVEGPLRDRKVVPVHTYHGSTTASVEPIEEPIDELLKRIWLVIHEPGEPDWFESDISFELPARVRLEGRDGAR